MSIILQSSGGGQVTIQEPTTASNFTQTLPAATGTVMVSGNMPAFSAFLGSAQTVSANTWTKVQINTETFDTAGAFDSTTNYRFTPLVEGYYQVNATLANDYTGGGSVGGMGVALYKNGSRYLAAQIGGGTAGYLYGGYSVSEIIYLNGSTDYIEMYGINGNTTSSAVFASGTNATRFSACLVRGA
jgi:hypothetical protein